MSYFVSSKVKELRLKRNMSQRELGDMLGISDRAVSKWETGLALPSAKNIIKLADIFSVPVEHFIVEDDTIETNQDASGMESLRELYKSGRGPSSSHTMGPEKACNIFKNKYPKADSFRVVLYGSLAKTGKGHGTDVVIQKTLSPRACKIEFCYTDNKLPHPNTMDLTAYKADKIIGEARVMSVGGGAVLFQNSIEQPPNKIYTLDKFNTIADYCSRNSIRLWQYVLETEGEGIAQYINDMWNTMKESIERGLSDTGILPGGLGVVKKAKSLFENEHVDESMQTKENRMVCAYAFAVGEQNASGETIVTAPTCGAAGIVPAVLYYQQKKNNYSDESIVRALMTAGVIGNLIKTNASISGAECGCQAEVGTACAMAAAALAELFELSLDKIEYSAEIAIEHHLGLTCDPICGLVQIPCIERNAVAAMRAINAVNLASFLWNTRKISLDKVIQTMKETGLDMHKSYKETSEAGLAKGGISY